MVGLVRWCLVPGLILRELWEVKAATPQHFTMDSTHFQGEALGYLLIPNFRGGGAGKSMYTHCVSFGKVT